MRVDVLEPLQVLLGHRERRGSVGEILLLARFQPKYIHVYPFSGLMNCANVNANDTTVVIMRRMTCTTSSK